MCCLSVSCLSVCSFSLSLHPLHTLKHTRPPPRYDWGTNCIHGVQSRCGSKCPTSFPNPNAQGAAWNRTLWRDMAHVTGVELRAMWLADVGENHADNLPHLGLDCWSPNINSRFRTHCAPTI